MRSWKFPVTGLLVILILGQIAMLGQSGWPSLNPSAVQDAQNGILGPIPEAIGDSNRDGTQFSISQGPITGTLDPVLIRQNGVLFSDNKSTRVDTATRAESNLTIDEQNGWAVSATGIDVWNIKRLYVENGTFTNGSDPWTAYTHDTDPLQRQIQTVTYNSTEEFVVTTNIGPETNTGQNIYTHFAGSEVVASQTVDNLPFAEEFYLSFKFLYASGPLDPLGDDLLSPVYLAAWFGSDVMGWNGWVWDMTTLDARNVWYQRNNIYVDPDILTGSTFEFQIGLYFTSNVDVDADLDYDDDGSGIPDGVENAEKIEVHIDDISVVSVNPLNANQVEMTFHAGELSAPITGTGESGSGTISNPAFWTQNPLTVEITSNMSISFDYRTNLASHRYTNSSWAADPTKLGVAYSVSPGQSADLSLYTYIGTAGQYQNLSLHVTYPSDWNNATIRNPFLNDVTSSCIITPGSIEIPNSILDNLGWWEIRLEAPNYAKSITTQKWDDGLGSWSDTGVFATGNITRIQASIGTAFNTPELSNPANFSWVLPNGTLWFIESISGGINGVVNSSDLILGGLNTTAGKWNVHLAWTNGTEIAYGSTSFAMHHSASLDLVSTDYETIETDSGLTVANFLRYTDADNGDFLMEDDATIVANWSVTQIIFEANLLRNWWEANFDTSIVGNGRFVVAVNASKPYYNDVSLQFTVISTHRTDFEFTSIGGIPPEIGLYEVYEVDMHYELQSSTGIEGASIYMTFSGPEGGLSLQTTTDDGLGDYSAFIVATESGTYTVTFTCSKDYHYNGTDSFTLIVGEVETSFSATNGTAGFVSFGRSYRLVVYYANSTGFGLDSATVEVAQVTPSSGLAYGAFTDEGNGYYSIELTPSSASTWTILVKANLTNHVTGYATFTLVVNQVPTVLTATVPGATVTIGENYVIELLFQDEDSTGLQGATITILDFSAGITIGTPVDMTSGYYNIGVTPQTAGTFQILFRASLLNHLNSTVGFTLVVNGFGSEFVCVNGTADFTLYGDTYRLVVSYTNTSGFGLAGADVEVVNIIPATGLQIGPTTYEGNGYYSLVLNATTAKIFTLLIKANLTDYSTQFVTFSFIVRETPTVLTLDDYEAEIAGDQQHTVQFLFEDEDSNGLEGAVIDVLNPPESLIFYSVIEMGSGFYNITIEPSEIGTFLIAFRAYLVNYQNATVGFTLIVSPAPTALLILEGISSDTVLFEDEYVLSLIYYRTDTGANVTGAQISVDWTPYEGITVSQYRIGDIYYISIRTHAVGTWTLFIAANKTAHATSITQFTLRANSITASVNEFTLLEALVYEGLYVFDFSYTMFNGTGISGATVTPSGSGAQWITYEEISQGVYRVNLTPEAVGNYDITFAFSKEGFQTRNSYLSFIVDPVIVQVIEIQGIDGIEGQTTTVSLRLVRADNGLPVSGAAVEIQLVDETGPRLIDLLEEVAGQPGLYSGTLTMPSAVSSTHLRIFVSLENFALSTDYYEVQMSPQVSEVAALSRMVQTYFPFILLLVVGVVGYSGRAAYLRRARARNIEAMVVKRRFDDVQSLLGVIVLHKHTGIPIYSRIVKGGLDETLVSGFISAITTFRKEFEIDQESESIIPISDIIRAISTENLICAFISLTAPSKAQELRMIEFAEAVGFVFDGMYTEPPARALDPGTASQFEALFDDLMDGKLLKMHKITEAKGIARGPKCLVKRINEVEEEGEFELQKLASRMALCGIEEARAYQIIWDALEKESIVAVYREERLGVFSSEE
ncbi:MAG: hypothetical protein EAX95_03515 [Candidatus Thorarchaeota archaeon]|nr:hypothetical protein [Candidatus Thorarchaeota archaeon]